MNNKEKQELKELIREVVKEELVKKELAKLKYSFICPVMETDKNIVYTTNTEGYCNE